MKPRADAATHAGGRVTGKQGSDNRGSDNRGSDERGTVLILIIGFAVIAALAVTVVVSASKAFVVRRSLASWADGAAVAAAQGVRADRLYEGGLGDFLPLDQAEANRAVSEYASRHELASRFDDFRILEVSVHGVGDRVRVTLAAEAPLAFVNVTTAGMGTSVPIRASATARGPLS